MSQIRTHVSSFPETDQSLASIKVALDELETTTATLDTDMTAVESAVATLETDVGAIETTLASTVNRVYAVPVLGYRQASLYTALSLVYGATYLVPDVNWSGTWSLKTADSHQAAVTNSAYFAFALPPRYSAAGDITVTLRSRVTLDMNVSQYVDVEIKKVGDGTLGADICATAHQAISTSWADDAFTITPTGLVAGDVLVCKVAVELDDTLGTADVKRGQITKVTVTCEESY